MRRTAGGADAVDVAGSEKPRKSLDPAIISVFEGEVRGSTVQVSATVSEDEVRGIAVSDTAGGADAVDVAESEEPRKSWAIISASEDEVRGTTVQVSTTVSEDEVRGSTVQVSTTVSENEVRGSTVQVSASVSEDEVRGSTVQVSATVSEDEVRGIAVSGTAGGADTVDAAGSAEPRESSDPAILSVTEDPLGKAELPKTAATEQSKSQSKNPRRGG